MSATAIRAKIAEQLRRDLRTYRPLADAWHTHREGCIKCKGLNDGAWPRCDAGVGLLGAARAAKWAVNVAGEEVTNVLGRRAAERIAIEELTEAFRPVPG